MKLLLFALGVLAGIAATLAALWLYVHLNIDTWMPHF